MTNEEAQKLYAIRLQRAQIKPEKSRALPQHAYGDPARQIKFESEKKKGKKCSG